MGPFPLYSHCVNVCLCISPSVTSISCALVAISDARNVICDLCGNTYKTEHDLSAHVRRVHLNKYPYHCQKCGHGVDKRSYLNNHLCGRVRRSQKQDLLVTGLTDGLPTSEALPHPMLATGPDREIELLSVKS